MSGILNPGDEDQTNVPPRTNARTGRPFGVAREHGATMRDILAAAERGGKQFPGSLGDIAGRIKSTVEEVDLDLPVCPPYRDPLSHEIYYEARKPKNPDSPSA